MEMKRVMCTQLKVFMPEDELRKLLGIRDVNMKSRYVISVYKLGVEGVEFVFEKSETID